MLAKTMKDSIKKSKSDLLKDLKFQQEYIDEQRMAIVYLNFDIEATRRERDYWKKRAGSK